MKRICLIFGFLTGLLFLKPSCYAQQLNNFNDNVRFGGGVGLSFSDGFFSGTITPSAIYQLTDKVALGAGLNFTYNSKKDYYQSIVYGGSLLSYFTPLQGMQLSAEFEELKVTRTWDNSYDVPSDNYWYSALFLGIGYQTGNVTVGVRYDVLYDKDKSIYAEPWAPFVRIYF